MGRVVGKHQRGSRHSAGDVTRCQLLLSLGTLEELSTWPAVSYSEWGLGPGQRTAVRASVRGKEGIVGQMGIQESEGQTKVWIVMGESEASLRT